MNPTAYVAGKYGGLWTKNAMYEVKLAGFDIPYNWMNDIRPKKPFVPTEKEGPIHRADNAASAQMMIDNAYSCDFFVLVVENNLYGALAELGAALASREDKYPRKEILIVMTPGKQRESIFFAAHGVEVIEWDQLRTRLKEIRASYLDARV